jgi:SAM-dependent methyltransferase
MESQEKIYTDSALATEFDKSRGYVWPGVKAYLFSLPAGTLVGDFGSGNGRNMLWDRRLRYAGCDLSPALVEKSRAKGLEVQEGNLLALPFEASSFDAGMCIAVLHHLETDEERRLALQEMRRVLKPGGKLLLTVWSKEQPPEAKREFIEGMNEVPWRDRRQGKVLCTRRYFIYSKRSWDLFITSLPGWCQETYFWERGNHYSVLLKI